MIVGATYEKILYGTIKIRQVHVNQLHAENEFDEKLLSDFRAVAGNSGNAG